MTPPALELVLLLGTLAFSNDRDLALNASKIFIRESEPDPSRLAS